MPTLYRSPDVLIDGTRWHVVVHQCHKSKHVSTVYRFRTSPREMWRSLPAWKGRLPKDMWQYFRPFKFSMDMARRSV